MSKPLSADNTATTRTDANVITPEIVDTQAVLPELSPEARWFMTRLVIADFVRLVEVKR